MNSPSNSKGPAAAWYRQLHFQVFIAMLLGMLLGAVGGEGAARWVGWMGTVFVRLMKMLIVPLILSSIVSGVASVGSARSLGRLGAKTLLYYLTTSFLAIFTGLVLVNLLKPGVGADLSGAMRQELPDIQPPDSLFDIFVRMIPTNPVEAMANGDMLGIIFFAIVLGVSLNYLRSTERERLQGLVDSAFEWMMVVTSGVMRLLPLGVLGLITQVAANASLDDFRAVGMYMLTIFLGLSLHVLVTLPLMLSLIGRMSPLVHYRNMREAMLTAFSTSSSAATLPVTLRCVEQRAGVSNRVSSFVLPMGATVNMDGTALYECVGVIFIAQVLGVHLGFAAQATIVVTALLASIGAAGIPSAGLVMIFIVTKAVNLTGPEVTLIVGTMLGIDRPLDMLRTMVNVLGDSCGAAIIARSEGESTVNQS
jgi:Na+/H+-dicarboxylate symporter